jgi:hypothetical protein
MTTHEQYNATLKATQVRSWFIKLFENQSKLYDEFMYTKNHGSVKDAQDAHTRFIAMKHTTEGFKAACEIFMGFDMVKQIVDSVVSEMLDSGIVREGD